MCSLLAVLMFFEYLLSWMPAVSVSIIILGAFWVLLRARVTVERSLCSVTCKLILPLFDSFDYYNLYLIHFIIYCDISCYLWLLNVFFNMFCNVLYSLQVSKPVHRVWKCYNKVSTLKSVFVSEVKLFQWTFCVMFITV